MLPTLESREVMFNGEIATFKRQILIPLNDERSKIPASSPITAVSLSGELGDSIRSFVHLMTMKQPKQKLAPLLQLCGEMLVSVGELKCAKEYFFAGAMNISQNSKPQETQEINDDDFDILYRDLGIETQTSIAIAKCDISTCLTLDPKVKFPRTVASLTTALRLIQSAMSKLLHSLIPKRHESIAWLLLNGCIEMYRVAEPLVTLGHAQQALEFLTWCALTMEAVVTLSATRHLHWRMRIYATIAHAYEDLGKLKGARNCIYHAREQVSELRRLEELDPPLPPKTEHALRQAEWDVSILVFKYDHALDTTKPLPSSDYEEYALTRAKTKPPSLFPELNVAQVEVPVVESAPPSASGKKKPGSSKGKKEVPVEKPVEPDTESIAESVALSELSLMNDEAARVFRSRVTGAAIVRFMACEDSLGFKSRNQRWRALCEALASAHTPNSRPLRDGFEAFFKRSAPVQSNDVAQGDDEDGSRRRALCQAALYMLLPLSVKACKAEDAADDLSKKNKGGNANKEVNEGGGTVEVVKEEKGKKEKLKKGKDKEPQHEEKANQNKKKKKVVIPELSEGFDAIRGPVVVTPPELLALLLALIQNGEFVDANILLCFTHLWLESSEAEDPSAVGQNTAGELNTPRPSSLFMGAGETSQVSISFNEDPEAELKEKELFYGQLYLIAASLRFLTWEHSEDKVTLEGSVPQNNNPNRPQDNDDDSISDAGGMGSWALFDEPPQLIRIGPPGQVKFLPKNYTESLLELLGSLTIYGAGDDYEGAAFLPSPSTDLAVPSHARDMIGDISLLVYRSVCLPLLKQIDSSEAIDFLNPSYDPTANTASDSPLDIEELADPLEVQLLVQSLLAVKAGMQTAKIDDPVLSASISLRLATVLGEPSLGGDFRRALQVCRVALVDIDQVRGELVSPLLHFPTHPLDLSALSTSAVSCEVSDQSTFAAKERPSGGHSDSAQFAGSWMNDPETNQKSKAVFGASSCLDPTTQGLAALHVDLLIMCFRLEFLLAEAQASHLASRTNSGNAPAHSTLALNEPQSESNKRTSRKFGSSSNVPFTPRSQTLQTLAQGLAGSLPSTMETLPDPLFVEPVIPKTVEAANQRSSLEARRNYVAKCLLLIEAASSLARTSSHRGPSTQETSHAMFLSGAKGACAPPIDEPPNPLSPLGKALAELLKEALDCLENAEAKEAELAKEVTSFNDWLGNFNKFEPLEQEVKESFRSSAPPSPTLVSRSDSSITIQPRRWFPNSKSVEVSYYRVYGKPAGSGTMVSTQNGDLVGCDENIKYNDLTGTCPFVVIKDLSPNESYVFAVAAYSKDGDLVGKIGATSPIPIETLNPLPTTLCWSYLASIALSLGQEEIARTAGAKVVLRMCTEEHRPWALPHPHGRNSGPLTAAIPASLLMKPSVLDRAPRSSLLALSQSLLVTVEVSKRTEPSLDADDNPDAGCLKFPSSSPTAIAALESSEGQLPMVGVVTLTGCSSTAAQQQALVQLHRLGLVVELGVMLKDFPLVQRCCHQAFNDYLRPLLSLASRSDMVGGPLASGPGSIHQSPFAANTGVWRHLFHPLARLHQAMSMVPPAGKTRSDDLLFALLTSSLCEAAMSAGEAKALRKALNTPSEVLELDIDDLASQASSLAGSPTGSVVTSTTTSAMPSAATSAAPSRASTANKPKSAKDKKEKTLEKEDSVDFGELKEPLKEELPPPPLSDMYMGPQRSPGTELAQLALHESLLSHPIGDGFPVRDLLKLSGVGGCEAWPLKVEEMLPRDGLQKEGDQIPKSDWPILPSDATVANFVMQAAHTDLDTAWGLLQHASLRETPSHTRLCCLLMESALVRSPGGGGGRVISLWMKHLRLYKAENLEALTLKAIQFESTQDHRCWLMAKYGVIGERALVPPYIEVVDDDNDDDGRGGHLRFADDHSRRGSEASRSMGSVGEDDADRSDVDDDDENDEGGDIVMEQLKGRPKDSSRTAYDAFCEIVSQPQASEKKQLLWLGRVEVLLALAHVDVFMNHSLAKDKLNKIASLGSFAADGPWTELRLFLDQVSISAPPPPPFEAPPPLPPRVPQLVMPGDFVKDEEMTDEEVAMALEKHQANIRAAEAELAEIKIENEQRTLAVFQPRYDASKGDIVGPLRDSVDHFCNAILRFRTGHAWRSLLATATELWNVCAALWISPFVYEPGALDILFPDELVNAELGTCAALPPTPWELMSHALLDFLEARAELPQSTVDEDESDDGDDLFQDDEDDGPTGESQNEDDSEDGEHENRHSPKLKVDLDFCSRFVTFGMSCLLMGRQWVSVVALGRRLNLLTLNLPIACDASHALMLTAQAAIVHTAQIEANRCEKLWEAHMDKVDANAAAQAKKKKRSRMSRGPATKTEEELELEQQGAPLKVLLSNARAKLQVAEYAQRWYLNTETTYRKTKSTSLSALGSCRDLVAAASHCSPKDPTKSIQIYNNAAAIYVRASKLLRDKREHALLQQAMNELGDVQLFGLEGKSGNSINLSLDSPFAKSWIESLNALMFAVDVHLNWETIYRDVLSLEAGKTKAKTADLQHSFLLPTTLVKKSGLLSCLIGANTIGKLACYASRDDRQKRFEFVLMSLPLWRTPFALSIAHPSRLIDYALYCPTIPSIFNSVNPFSNPVRLSISQTMLSLEHSISCLLEQNEGLLALPLCAFLESLARDSCSNVRLVLRARLLRLECLICAGLIAEAVSVLASLLKGAHLPRVAGGYSGMTFDNRSSEPVTHSPAPPLGADSPYPPPLQNDLTEQDAEMQENEEPPEVFSAATLLQGCPLPVRTGGEVEPTSDPFTGEGLCFYGLAPFASHETPGSDTNKQALKWLTADINDDFGENESMASKSKNSASTRGSKSKKKAVSAAEEDLLELVTPEPPIGARDVPVWLRKQFGLAGLRSLALARGRLLSTMTSGRGLGEGFTGDEARVISKCRDAADVIAKDTADQCLQRSFIAYQKGLDPEAPEMCAAAARKAVLDPKSKMDAPEDVWAQIEVLEMQPCLLRCFVSALTLRASIAMEDAKYDEAQKYALIAVNAVERQMEVVRNAVDENGNHVKRQAPPMPTPPVRKVMEVELPPAPVVEEVEEPKPDPKAKGKKGKAKPSKKVVENLISPEEQAEIDAAKALKELEFRADIAEQDAKYAAQQVAWRLWEEQLDDADWSRLDEEEEGVSVIGIEKWLALREILARAALGQGRNDDCLLFVVTGLKEAHARNEVKYSRRLQLIGARALARMGSMGDAEKQTADLLHSLASEHLSGGSLDFAKASSFASGLLRERAIGSASSSSARSLLGKSISLLDDAIVAVAKQARSSGFLGISELTFMRGGGSAQPHGVTSGEPILDNTMLADLAPPLLTQLLRGYESAEAKGVKGVQQSDLPDAAWKISDVSDVNVASSLANIYLQELPVMVSLLSARCSLVLELAIIRDFPLALRLANEALSLLRYCACPLPLVRAKLLLLVGKLRRRLLVLTEDEINYHVLETEESKAMDNPAPSEPAVETKQETKPTKEKKGKKNTPAREEVVVEPSKGKPKVPESLSALLDSDTLFNLPFTHPVASCAACLLGSLSLSFAQCGHDHSHMIECCTEVALLLGDAPVPSMATQHLNCAMQFVSLAAQLRLQRKALTDDLPVSLSNDPLILKSPPPALLAELQSSSHNGKPTARAALELLIGLEREEAADPNGLLDTHNRPLLASLHRVLEGGCSKYKEACCMDAKSLVSAALMSEEEVEKSFGEDLLCVQWNSSEKESEVEDDHRGIKPYVEAIALIGQCTLVSRFLETSHLGSIPAISIQELRSLHHRAALFRRALHLTLEKDEKATLPQVVLENWKLLLCDIYLAFAPNSKNKWVGMGELRLSSGEECNIPCDVAHLKHVESLLNQDLGVRTTVPFLAAWIRDALSPVL